MDYAKFSYEISKSKENKQLVSSNHVMLDFDAICSDADFYPKKNRAGCNQPSTVDALYYRILDENHLELHLVEFKSFYFNWNKDADYAASLRKIKNRLDTCGFDNQSLKGFKRLENIKKRFGDTVEFSLKIKPYESLFVVLPKIYEEYCEEKNIPIMDRLDLYDFFKSDECLIKLFIVGKKSKYNINSAYLGKLAHSLEKQYKRLDFVNILTQHPQRLCFNDDFDIYAQNLISCEKNNVKSLNFSG